MLDFNFYSALYTGEMIESNLKQTYVLFFVMVLIIQSSLFLFLSSFKLLDIESRNKNDENTDDFFLTVKNLRLIERLNFRIESDAFFFTFSRLYFTGEFSKVENMY